MGGLASHSIQRNHSVEIKHYKELGDFDLQWLMPLNLAVFKSSVVAIFSSAMFFSRTSKKFPSLSLQSLLIASDGFFSQQEVQNTLNEQGRSTQQKVKFLSRAHQHGPCGFTRVPVLIFKSCVF